MGLLFVLFPFISAHNISNTWWTREAVRGGKEAAEPSAQHTDFFLHFFPQLLLTVSE